MEPPPAPPAEPTRRQRSGGAFGGGGGGGAGAAAGGTGIGGSGSRGSGSGRKGPRLLNTCVQCKKSKSKCDGALPCSRCFKTCLPCRPGTRRPRRPSKPPAAESGSAGPSSNSSPLQSQSQAQSLPLPPLPAPPLVTPLVELVMERADPRASVEVYLQAWHRVHATGRIDRGKALRIMRMWHLMGALCGSDITWGVAAQVARTLNASRAEVEGEEGLRLGMPDGPRRRKAAYDAAELAAASEELKATDVFKRAGRWV